MKILEGIEHQRSIRTVLVGIITALLVYWLIKKFRYRKPPGPFALPFIGNYRLFNTDKDLPRTIMEMAKKYGPVIKVHMGPTEMYILNTIEITLDALVKKGSDFANRVASTTEADLTEGRKDIVLADYTPTWKLHRKISSKALRHYLKGDQLQMAIEDSMNKVVKVISNQKEALDPTEYIDYIVFNILCALCFKTGYNFNDPEFKRIMGLTTKYIEALGAGTLEDIFPFIKKFTTTNKYKNVVEISDELHVFFNGKLEEHRATFDADNIRDFTDSLLLARQEAEQEDDPEQLSGLTDVHLRQTLSDIFFAGIDTSRITMYWAVLCLAVHREFQVKCQKEVDSVVGREKLPKTSDRPHLPYTEAFLMEAMRMYPAAGFGLPHAAMRDSSINGYDAPKGTVILVNHHAILNDPRHWEKPEEFNPDRFLNKDGKMLPKPESWLPFSAGRRVCLGESVARPELLTIFATLIHQFDIKLPEGFVHSMEFVNATFQPVPKPFKVHMKIRS